jgi:WD40 repeat protein
VRILITGDDRRRQFVLRAKPQLLSPLDVRLRSAVCALGGAATKEWLLWVRTFSQDFGWTVTSRRAVPFSSGLAAHMSSVGKDLEVADPPADGISSIKYSWGNGAFLLATSWDATLRLYDGAHGMPKASFSGGVALLDGCFSSRGQQIFSAGVDGKIKRYV